MDILQRSVRRGWIALTGGMVLAFAYLIWMPYLGTAVTDTIAVWLAATLGALAGAAIDARTFGPVRMTAPRHVAIEQPAKIEVLAR